MNGYNRDMVTELAAKRAELLTMLDQATDNLRAWVRIAVKDGMTEVEAARLAGVTRVTIRKWLGK